ncbi:carbohydrate ABC transporter permease [Caldibacillus lycopersici]|uniref:Carbohydrate ABC transporter permease n=1 Tax=Perspicuibacillus lycopersici TaxID=1325689 RepID=A0AAE3LM25_9BACI|nr:carbohydrate ABC transporter permease [Perspicuibacillus lycopersici]MCU9613090.1 carbohydrate ABC transporter permease [Perspicuibacillus lycopersici]
MFKKVGLVEKVVLYALLSGIGVALIIPFIYMISISLASGETVAKMEFTIWPREFTWHNFVELFSNAQILNYFKNSIILVIFAIIGQVLSSSFVAFGFSRLNGKGKNFLFLVLLSTMMIPGQITMIPQFIIFSELGWLNTLLPIIVPNFFASAFNVFLLRQFMSRIPRELDEAAKIDGLGYFGIYWRIMLPLLKPILIAVAIFTFNANWGLFMEPLIYINDVEKMPLALGVQILSSTFSSQAVPPWNIVMGASLLLTVPMLLVFFFGQKYMFEANINSGSSGSK